MNKIKKCIASFIFNQKIKKQSVNYTREKKFMNYEDIRTILILYKSSPTENNPMIDAFVKELTSDGKKVTTCGFIKKKKTESPILKDKRIINLAQISLFGEPKNNIVADLLADEYDMVLDLTLYKIIPLRYILAYAKSPFKVGRKIEDKDLLDFMIRLTPSTVTENESLEKVRLDEDYLFNQVFFYIKSIKSNN